METSFKQKAGIIFSIIGGVLLLGFNWAGGYILLIGTISVIAGLVLALKDEYIDRDSKWVHGSTHTDDE